MLSSRLSQMGKENGMGFDLAPMPFLQRMRADNQGNPYPCCQEAFNQLIEFFRERLLE